MHEGEVTPEDRPFVVSTLRVKRKKEKKKKWRGKRESGVKGESLFAHPSWETIMSRTLPLLLDVVSTLFIRLAFFFFSSTRVLLSTAIYTHYYFASATDQNEKNCTRIARIRVSLENWRNERSFVACFAHPSILSCRNDKMMKLQTIQIVRFAFQFKKKKR